MSGQYEVGPTRAITAPRVTERRLANGLRVIAVRRPGIPRFQARLRVDAGTAYDRVRGNRARLAADAMQSGTRRRSAFQIARDLQSMGASMGTSAGLDYITISGGGLTSGFETWLELLAEILCDATYPHEEIEICKAREMQALSVRRSRPDAIARSRLVRAVYGRHPYGRGTPDPESVAPIRRDGVRRYHAARVRPRGATLVLVGDFQPTRAIALADDALARWRGSPRGETPRRPRIADRARTIVVDRPGAVQTNIRIAAPAVPRTDPSIFGLAIANTIFGGYFSSRLVENIREDKGYTYSPRSALEHHRVASVLSISADVGTEVTVPALVEIRYELAKMISASVDPAEIGAARTYLSGLTGLSIQTQAGLADYLSSLFAAGLDLDYLRGYQKNLSRIEVADVAEAAVRFLAPERMTTVLVGDAEAILPRLGALEAVEVVTD